MRVRNRESTMPSPRSQLSGNVTLTVKSHNVPLEGDPWDSVGTYLTDVNAHGAYPYQDHVPIGQSHIVDENHTMKTLRRITARNAKMFKAGRPGGSRLPEGVCQHMQSKVSAGGAGSVTFLPTSRTFRLEGGLLGNLDYSDVNWSYTGGLTYTPQVRLMKSILPALDFDPVGAAGFSCGMIDLARQNAVAAILPGIKSRWQAPLFIAEILQVQGLLVQLARAIKHIGPQVIRVLAEFLYGRPGGARRVASKQLLVQFGLLPLVSDFSQCYDVFRNLASEVKEYKRKQNKMLVSHAQESLKLSSYVYAMAPIDASFSGEEEFLFPLWDEDARHYECDLVLPVDCHVDPRSTKYNLTAKYMYTCPVESGAWLALISALDAFGINASPRQFWNGIPFSFVVDWFTNVSALLEANANLDWSKGIVTIHGCVESIKYKWEGKVPPGGSTIVFRNLDSIGQTWDVVDNRLNLTNISSGGVYCRRAIAGLPAFSSTGFRMPSGMQWISATSLLVQGLHP